MIGSFDGYYVPPRSDLTKLHFQALPGHLRTGAMSDPPARLFHGTAAGEVFEQFDLARSSGCIWFATERQTAEENAIGFAATRGPGIGRVYVCDVRLARVAWFANESEILRFGGGTGGGDSKARAAEQLRLLGYDGMSDLYDGRRAPSFAALSADIVTIVEVYSA